MLCDVNGCLKFSSVSGDKTAKVKDFLIKGFGCEKINDVATKLHKLVESVILQTKQFNCYVRSWSPIKYSFHEIIRNRGEVVKVKNNNLYFLKVVARNYFMGDILYKNGDKNLLICGCETSKVKSITPHIRECLFETADGNLETFFHVPQK